MYVDDLIVTVNIIEELNLIINHLDKAFSIKDLEDLRNFIGIEVIKRSEAELVLCQRKYILGTSNRGKMCEAKPMPTPMVSNLHLSKYRGKAVKSEKHYRSIMGVLQYVTITRPDISFSINEVRQYIQKVTEDHWKL